MFLFSWLTGLMRRLSSPVKSRRAARPRLSPVSRVERLEPRQLLSAAAVGPEFRVNTTTAGDQRTNTTGQGGSMALDAAGDFVVTWTSAGQDGSGQGIYAQRYNAAGVAQGVEFRVNTTTAGDQINSTVALDAAGDFVVTWTSYGQDTANSFGIYAQRYNAAGAMQGVEFPVNTTTAGAQRNSTVALDAAGDFVITWSSNLQDGSGYGVYAQRYDESTDTAGPIVAQVLDGNRQIPAGGRLTTTFNSLTVVFSEDLNVTGGTGGTNSVTNVANWQLTQDGVDVSGSLSGVTFGFNAVTNRYEAVLTFSAPLTAGTFQLTALPAIRDLAGNALDGDRNGTPGGNFNHAFAIANVPTAGGEFRVNTTTVSNQEFSSVALDAAGDFVVTWSSYLQDGSAWGVYAQRYNAAGVA